MKMILTFLLSIITLVWNPKTEASATVIKGNNKELAGEMVYLKDYDHFNYLNDDYILDSCKVDMQGHFSFSLTIDNSKLVTIFADRNLPASYKVFRESPEFYFYSFCANFFGLDPTLFIAPNETYEIIRWDFNNAKESIKFNDNRNNLIRNYYRGHDFLKDITSEDEGIPLEIAPDSAWSIVESQRDSIINEFELSSVAEDAGFEHYLKTEILLGAINDYLIWYDYQEFYERDEGFYKKFVESYNAEKWHPLSLEYFKLTERYISYQMNQETGEKLIYYPPSDKKIEYAKVFVKENVRAKYISNLVELSKGSSE